MHCQCGRQGVLANGRCKICDALSGQGEAHFGGLREAVLCAATVIAADSMRSRAKCKYAFSTTEEAIRSNF